MTWLFDVVTYALAAYGVWCLGLRVDDWLASLVRGHSDADK